MLVSMFWTRTLYGNNVLHQKVATQVSTQTHPNQINHHINHYNNHYNNRYINHNVHNQIHSNSINKELQQEQKLFAIGAGLISSQKWFFLPCLSLSCSLWWWRFNKMQTCIFLAHLLVVWQSKPWRVEKQNYVHMFFLHGAGVLAILQTSYVSVVFIVFSVVFAHLIQQNITKIINSRKNIRNTGMCTMMLILNGIALILLRQETAESSWHIHILCSVVALLSISVYIVYTYIESYAWF